MLRPCLDTARRAVLAILVLSCLPVSAMTHADDDPPPFATVGMRLPADIVYEDSVDADGRVLFRHTTHLAFLGTRCTACHPATFSILQPVHRVSHDVMNAGGACGACHDGVRAHGVTRDGDCAGCHTGWGAPAAPVATSRIGEGDMAVTFRHETHPRDCAACHPAPFALKARGTPLESRFADMHEACGTCHDGASAFACEADESCERCHTGGSVMP